MNEVNSIGLTLQKTAGVHQVYRKVGIRAAAGAAAGLARRK